MDEADCHYWEVTPNNSYTVYFNSSYKKSYLYKPDELKTIKA